MTRGVLLWQIADLLGQFRWGKLFWAAQDPKLYGGYIEDMPE